MRVRSSPSRRTCVKPSSSSATCRQAVRRCPQSHFRIAVVNQFHFSIVIEYTAPTSSALLHAVCCAVRQRLLMRLMVMGFARVGCAGATRMAWNDGTMMPSKSKAPSSESGEREAAAGAAMRRDVICEESASGIWSWLIREGRLCKKLAVVVCHGRHSECIGIRRRRFACFHNAVPVSFLSRFKDLPVRFRIAANAHRKRCARTSASGLWLRPDGSFGRRAVGRFFGGGLGRHFGHASVQPANAEVVVKSFKRGFSK
jgi:hypothetical protein